MAALSTAFSFGMELYIIEDYKNIELGTAGADMETAGSVPTEEGSGRTSPGSRLTNALVKELLISNSHVSEEEWKRNRMRILRQPGGKPVLEPNRGICFSVSHTGDVFACVIAEMEETSSVGLDIQQSRNMDVQKLALRFYTEEENQWLNSNPEGFFRLWTRKEAYAKYTGAGLVSVLEKTSVLGRTDVIFEDLDLGNGLYGCICRE